MAQIMLADPKQDQRVASYIDQKGTRLVMCSKSNPAAMKSDEDEGEKAERRIELERRRFLYSAHIPERRSGRKRRKEPESFQSSSDPRDQRIDEQPFSS